MAFVSEVTAKLNVDKTGVERDITQVVNSFGKAGQAIDKQLSKGFGFKKLAKSLLGGFGFASASDLKEMITKPFAEAAESAKRIEETTAETARIYERIFEARRTDQQNLEKAQRDQLRLARELEETKVPQIGVFETIKASFLSLLGGGGFKIGFKAIDQQKQADIAKEQAETQEKQERLARKIAEDEKRFNEQKARNAEEFAKKQADLDEQVEDFLRSQMSVEDQIKSIEAERMDIAERMAISDEDTLDLQKRELELQQRITQLEKQQADAAKRKAEQANRIAKQLVSAGQGVEKAKADYQTQLADRSGFTLGEVAAGKTTQSEKAAARRILSYEARARRVRSMKDFRDPSGKLVSGEEYANQLISKADQLRKGIGSLTSKEKDPMAEAAEAIKKSEEHLASIDTKLTPEEIE